MKKPFEHEQQTPKQPFEQQTANAIRILTVTVAILIVAAVGAIGLSAVGFVRSTSIIGTNCQQIENLKVVIHRVVVASAASLGKPGTSGYSYYRDHPKELAAAKVTTLTEAQQFSPRSCS